MAQRMCSMTDCSKPHRARGMCSTHYNRAAGETARHPKVTTACVICSTLVRRRKDSTYQPTCSVTCRTIVQVGERETVGYDWRRDAARRARKYGCRVVELFNREDIFGRDQWTCQSCGVQCNQPNPYDRTAATVDHVVPLHLGGEHSRANAQTLCLSCNAAKQDQVGISPAA